MGQWKDKKYCFVYKTTNLVTGEYYLGCHLTDDLDDGYLGTGHNIIKQIKEFGKENFKREIIKFFDTKEEAFEYERFIINEETLSDDKCLNINIGGHGGWSNKMRQDIANKNRDKKRTKEQCDNIAQGIKEYYKDHDGYWKNKHLPKEACKKISESKKGKPSQNKGKKTNKPSWNKGKKGVQVAWNKGLTKETDERVAKYAKSIKQSPKKRVPWNKGKKLNRETGKYE